MLFTLPFDDWKEHLVLLNVSFKLGVALIYFGFTTTNLSTFSINVNLIDTMITRSVILFL